MNAIGWDDECIVERNKLVRRSIETCSTIIRTFQASIVERYFLFHSYHSHSRGESSDAKKRLLSTVYVCVCVRVCVCTYNICYYSSKHIRISFTITYTKRFVRRCNSLDCCYCCSSRKKTKKDVNHLERFFLSNEAKLVSRLFFRSTSGISRECTTISSISLSFSQFSTTRHVCSNIIYIYIYL